MKTLYINRNDERTFRDTASQYWILFKILRPIDFYIEIKEIGKTVINSETVGDVIVHKYLIRNNNTLRNKLSDYIPIKEDFEFYTYEKQPNSLAAIVIKDNVAYFCMPSNSIYEIKYLATQTEDFLEICNGYRTSDRVIELDEDNTIYPTIRRTVSYSKDADTLIYEDNGITKVAGNYIKGFLSSDLGETRTIRFSTYNSESCYIRLFVSVSGKRNSEIILFVGKESNVINVKGKVINGDINWDDISLYTYSAYVYCTIKQGSRLYILEYTNLNKLGSVGLNYTIGGTVPDGATELNIFDGNFYSTKTDYSNYPDGVIAPHAQTLFLCYYDGQTKTIRRYDGNNWNTKLAGVTSERPTDNLRIGTSFFDTTLQKPIWRYNNMWFDSNGNNSDFKSQGTFIQKPNNPSIGFAYFCTDRQTSEGSSNGIMIYHKGDNVWVDALGRIVE